MGFSQIYNGMGLGPGTWQFPVRSSNQLLLVSGSAFALSNEVLMSVNVIVNSHVVGTLRIYSNSPREHRAFVPLAIPLRLVPTIEPNMHTIQLQIGANTVVDANDPFSITLTDQVLA